MDVSKIDITQVQAVIANVEALANQLDQLIPGTTGQQIRSVVQLVELIVNNTAVLQFVLWVLSQLPTGATTQDIQKIVQGFDVNSVVAS